MRSLLFLLLTVLVTSHSSQLNAEAKRWAVVYSKSPKFEELLPYSPVVLAREVDPIIQRLRDSEKIVLGYVNLGELAEESPYFTEAKRKGLLLEENANWPGSFMVDIRKPAWAKMVIEKMIPETLFRHFNGLFLDTIDNAIYLEQKDPKKYKGMKEAAIHLIKGIRLHYPSIPLMLNRGYDILPDVAGQIDMELGESVYSTYDFAEEKYQLVPNDAYQHQVDLLKKAKEKNIKLAVYTLDYWKADDPETIKEIYQVERDNGFIPYVSTIDLQKIVEEPK